jgi:hypothetical protein
MKKLRSSTRLSYTSCTCTIPSTLGHGMRVLPMFNTTTTKSYIAQPNTTPFRWGWDFICWVPWMLHYSLWPPKKTHRMLQLEMKNPLSSLRKFITSANRFRIFYRSPMLSTSNAVINIGCYTCLKWQKKFGCT